MIDPPKATKGRRMSKKTRKKSAKSPSPKPARARSKISARTPAARTRKAAAKKSGKSARKQPGKTTVTASHKAPSKKLRSPGPGAAESNTTAAKPKAANPKAATPKAGTPLAAKSSGATTDAAAARHSALAEGAMAPGFRLPRDGGDTVALSDFSGRQLVLFFYPRADTPGCTREAIDFTRLAGAFAENQTAVLGISADPLKVQETFRDKHRLSVPLVSDETHEMLEAYGVWGEKSMYGKTFLGILRTTVLIGADGRIARIWRHVKVDGHADDVLAAARVL